MARFRQGQRVIVTRRIRYNHPIGATGTVLNSWLDRDGDVLVMFDHVLREFPEDSGRYVREEALELADPMPAGLDQLEAWLDA